MSTSEKYRSNQQIYMVSRILNSNEFFFFCSDAQQFYKRVKCNYNTLLFFFQLVRNTLRREKKRCEIECTDIPQLCSEFDTETEKDLTHAGCLPDFKS